MSRKILVKGYQVGRKIDDAGMRSMYRALRIRTGEDVFITIIRVRAGRSLNQLIRRAEQSRKLILPALVSAEDHGVLSDDRFYYTHKAQASRSLGEVLSEIRSEEERLFLAVSYFLKFLEVVEYIHSAGTTHRDLGTSQIRVLGPGKILLEGFVNARPRVEARNMINLVNVPYMAPEQFRGVAADPRTDIYACGTILYELITGIVPYDSNFMKQEESAKGVIPSPSMHKMDVPAELEGIVVKMLASRDIRYSNVQELIFDLEQFHSTRSVKLKLKELSAAFKRVLSFR